MEAEIKFPLSHPTHYIACLNNFDVTHVAIRLSSATLWTLFKLILIPKILAFFKISGLTRYRAVERNKPLLDITFYKYQGKEELRPATQPGGAFLQILGVKSRFDGSTELGAVRFG